MGQVPPGAEGILLVLSILSYAVQVLAWIWIRGLAKRLKLSRAGASLVSIVSFLLGGTLLIRAVGGGILLVIGRTNLAPVYIIAILSQIAFLWLCFEVWRRMRQFMDEP